MARSRIYTRKGDQGTCQLIGGLRVRKDENRVDCYGTFDEACSFIGLLRVRMDKEHPMQNHMAQIQRNLMELMAVVANAPNSTSEKAFSEQHTKEVESWIDETEKLVGEKPNFFLLPGGCETAALSHVIRTVIRRAERTLSRLNQSSPVQPSVLSYTNRLSDFFFLFSRFENSRNQIAEEPWTAS